MTPALAAICNLVSTLAEKVRRDLPDSPRRQTGALGLGLLVCQGCQELRRHYSSMEKWLLARRCNAWPHHS